MSPSLKEDKNLDIAIRQEGIGAQYSHNVDDAPATSWTQMFQTEEVLLKAHNKTKVHSGPFSSQMAQEHRGVKGAIQLQHDRGETSVVTDLGWNKPSAEIPDPLLNGISNETLWAMIRRFNKDVIGVEATSQKSTTGLDLIDSWEDDCLSDKMALSSQRLYLRIVLGLASFQKQLSRLRSWKETRRTALFCIAYTTAWMYNLLVPLVLGTLTTLIASEKCRNVLFPSAPRALVNSGTGGLQTPQAGQLGSLDSLTGASEKRKGEAIEEEASNFFENLRHLAMRASGVHEGEEGEGDPLEGKVPKRVRNAFKAIKNADSPAGHATEDDSAQTQAPMEDSIWSKAKPEKLWPVVKSTPHAMGEIADYWERVTNAISPIEPFSHHPLHMMIALFMSLFSISLFVSSHNVWKATTLMIGCYLFGDPFFRPVFMWINHNYPKWVEVIQPKNNILYGVPTNNQLTISLLRISEAHNSPIPPEPHPKGDDPDRKVSLDTKKIPLGTSHEEIKDAIESSPPGNNETATSDEPVQHKHLAKVISSLKGKTKLGIAVVLGIDNIRAKGGSSNAKLRLGVLPKSADLIYAGPSEFKARFEGVTGWLCIVNNPRPQLCFTTKALPDIEDGGQLEPVFEIDIENVTRLTRTKAISSVPLEKAVDWMSANELLQSIEIVDGNGKMWNMTALPERDHLFNRLIAIGGQRWKVQ